MTRTALIATILMVVTGCDKAKSAFAGGAPAQAAEPPIAARLDLSTTPDILFQVFGERDDPRMVPIGVLRGGSVRPIVLTAAGWRQFDAMYGREGSRYTVYQDGRAAGALSVRRRMWQRPDAPLYSLPDCRALVPLQAVALDPQVRGRGYTVERLASNARLGRVRDGTRLAPAAVAAVAREVGHAVAVTAGIPSARLDSLDFHAVAVRTGVTRDPTIIGSFVEPNRAGDVGRGSAVHVFAIADGGPDAYAATYAHAVYGPATAAEYRRYVDHLDLDGDGIDELILEAWRYGGDSYPLVLGFRAGRWNEIFRGRGSWCLDG